jgi:hypothetical protein
MSETAPLTGAALLARVEELKPAPGSEVAIACGYVSDAGKARLSAFKDALLDAHGHSRGKAPKAARRGKPLSFQVTTNAKSGNILLAGGYAALIGIEPGGQVAIAHNGRTLVLTPADDAMAGMAAVADPAAATYDAVPVAA